MKLRFTVYTPTNSSAPCNGALSVVSYTHTTLTLSNGLLGVVSNLSIASFSATVNFIMVDNNGNELACSAILVGNVLTIDIPLLNIWDNVNLGIKLTNSMQGLNTYNQLFTIFGYDLGNDIVSGITTNQNFDLVMINTAANQAYSGVIAYRKPFTTKVYYYSNNSSLYTSLNLYDGNNNVISNMSFGTTCASADIKLYYIIARPLNTLIGPIGPLDPVKFIKKGY